MKCRTLFVLAGMVLAAAAAADDRDAYNLRAATEDLAVFHRLARDGVLNREDTRADISFSPRFDAADVNRDGVVTAEEMRRYIEQAHGVAVVVAPPPATGVTGTK